jgi:hypothetical protein
MVTEQEHNAMSTAYDVRYPEDMVQAARGSSSNWAQATIRSTVDYIEDYARAKPLPFALWAFGIGFVLGWKLKPW